MMGYLTINTVTELACFFIALFCLFKDKDRSWTMLIVYLFLTCMVEFLGAHIRKVLHQPNYMVYNFFLLVECGITSYFYYYLYKSYKNTLPWLIAWFGIFMCIYGIELYQNRFKDFAFISSSIMSVVFVFASLYFYFLMLKDEQYRKLSSYAPFWWVNGTIFFYFGSTTCNIFLGYLIHTHNKSMIRYVIFNLLNILLYCFWSYAFICRYRQRRSFS